MHQGNTMKLRDWLYKKGISQTGFARVAGINSCYLSLLMSGRRKAGRDAAQKIDKATNGEINLESIFSGKAFDKKKEGDVE